MQIDPQFAKIYTNHKIWLQLYLCDFFGDWSISQGLVSKPTNEILDQAQLLI